MSKRVKPKGVEFADNAWVNEQLSRLSKNIEMKDKASAVKGVESFVSDVVQISRSMDSFGLAGTSFKFTNDEDVKKTAVAGTIYNWTTSEEVTDEEFSFVPIGLLSLRMFKADKERTCTSLDKKYPDTNTYATECDFCSKKNYDPNGKYCRELGHLVGISEHGPFRLKTKIMFKDLHKEIARKINKLMEKSDGELDSLTQFVVTLAPKEREWKDRTHQILSLVDVRVLDVDEATAKDIEDVQNLWMLENEDRTKRNERRAISASESEDNSHEEAIASSDADYDEEPSI